MGMCGDDLLPYLVIPRCRVCDTWFFSLYMVEVYGLYGMKYGVQWTCDGLQGIDIGSRSVAVQYIKPGQRTPYSTMISVRTIVILQTGREGYMTPKYSIL